MKPDFDFRRLTSKELFAIWCRLDADQIYIGMLIVKNQIAATKIEMLDPESKRRVQLNVPILEAGCYWKQKFNFRFTN
jgi:hypothetical protein